MDTFAIRSNRVHSTCSGGDEDSEEKEAIRMEKELIRLDKEEIRFEKESIMLERESIRLEREAISLEKEAIRLEKEAIRSEKEAIRSEKEAVQEGLYEVEDVRRKRVSKGQTQYLIKWLGWPESHNTWEPIENLQECLDIVAAFEERLCSRGRKRKRKGTFSQPMKTETIDEEGKGNEAIDNLFSKSGAKWMTYENVRMFENDTSVLDLDDAQNGDKSEDVEGPTRHAAAGDQHEVEMFSNPCSNGVQDVCVEFAAISEPNLVLDREVLEEQSNASVCEANIATSVVLDSEVKSCSQDDRNFTVEVGSQPHPSERTGDHWKPCPTDLPCASKSAQGSPPRKTSCQQGSPLTEEVTQVNSKMSSHTSHESPRKSADDTTTAGLEVPNDKASPLKNELLLCKEECQDSEGGTDQGTDQFISIPDAPGKDDLLKSFTKTLEEVTPKKQIKRSWDSTLSTLSPRSLGVVKCVAPAEEIRPLGSIEGSNTEPSLVPTVQPSNLPDLNISIPTLASFQHPLTDSK